MLYPNGDVSVKIDATGSTGAAAVAATSCTEFDYSIYKRGGWFNFLASLLCNQ